MGGGKKGDGESEGERRGRERDDRRRGTSIDRRVATASRVASAQKAKVVVCTSFFLPSRLSPSCIPYPPFLSASPTYFPATCRVSFSRLRHRNASLSLNSVAFLLCVSSFTPICFVYFSEYNCSSILNNVFFALMLLSIHFLRKPCNYNSTSMEVIVIFLQHCSSFYFFSFIFFITDKHVCVTCS